MKVYFAKSNKCNPDTVMRVRQKLQSLDCDIAEFQGGTYNDKDLIESDMLIVLPDIMLEKNSARIGRGLAGQLHTFSQTNGKDKTLICYMVSSADILVSKFVKIEVDDPRSWVEYGRVFFREEPDTITKYIPRKIEEML